MTKYQHTPWAWHHRDERGERNGSIYSMRHPGHAYAVAMQPRYVESDQWAEDASFIVKAVNAHEALVNALEVLLEEAESFSVSGVYFSEDCMGHKGPALARAALALSAADRGGVS